MCIRDRVQSEEEIEIEDYELPCPLEGNTRLWEINALCWMVQEMQGTPLYYDCLLYTSITAEGYKIGTRGFTNYILHADDMVKA